MVDEKRLGELFERALAGDQAAYRSFLEELAARLRLEYQDEDLVRAILLALHEKRDLYRAGMPIMSWVGVIARKHSAPITVEDGPRGRLTAFFRRTLDGKI